MKKLLILFCALILSACTPAVPTPSPASTACAVGGDKDCSRTDKADQYIEIMASDTFEAMSLSDLNKAIENKETFVVYIGFKNCPWCQDAVAYLKEIADANNIKVKYVNVRTEGDTKEFDQRVDTNADYVKLQETFKDILSDDSKKIYVPLVVTIKDGAIVNHHYGTLDEHDATERDLNEDEIKQLIEVYTDMLKDFK